MTTVRTGLEALLSDRISLLRGKRVGLICNASTVTSDLRHAADLFHAHPDFELRRLFGPEHGLRGDAQDMIPVEGDNRDRRTGVPVVTLYGPQESSLWPDPDALSDLDVLVFDIQDVGARYYTYVYTMAHAMEMAGQVGVPVVICDRPNPIGGELVEGNVVAEGYRSFVGRFPLANRHGMTAGELATWFRDVEGVTCDLTVVPMDGWERGMSYANTGLPWVQPSPNMPTPTTALVYPGQCFFEGTLMSEGRGTTRPFELVGAPFVDGHRWAEVASDDLRAGGYDGFTLRPCTVRPTFHKHAGEGCGAVQLHVTDERAFRPVMVATALLKAAWTLWPDAARWRTERYEFVSEPIAIDLLSGGPELRAEVESGAALADIQARWDAQAAPFLTSRSAHLRYR